MARPDLDALRRAFPHGSQKPFERAFVEGQVGYDCLVAHIEELTGETILQVLAADFGPEVSTSPRPFLQRLVSLLDGPHLDLDFHLILSLLRISQKIPSEAWIDDLVVPLRGRLPQHLWYRFVDQARGDVLFNALNKGTPRDPASPGWDPAESISEAFEKERPEPTVVAVLDRANNDLAVKEFALARLPVGELLELHLAHPDLVSAEAVKAVLPSRFQEEHGTWVPSAGVHTLPEWMTPFALERLRYCGEQEARDLFGWLFLDGSSRETELRDVEFEMAAARYHFAVAHGPWTGLPDWLYWSKVLGRHLATGKAWKDLGYGFIRECIKNGRGFPMQLIDDALDASPTADGRTRLERERAILRRAHEQTARVLVELAEESLHKGDAPSADRFLSAMMCLDPGSFIAGLLHHLQEHPAAPPELKERISTCNDLVRSGQGEPSREGLDEAFLVLTRLVP